tara:strand:+ start:6685 stop:6969 length:285 start_codon:yes stop_codon:yes gene_type:complete
MKKNDGGRDFFLGLLSALGLDAIINKISLPYFMFIQNKALSTTRIIAIIQLLVYIIAAVFIYKKIDLSEDYKKWFLVVAILVLIGNLLMSSLLF